MISINIKVELDYPIKDGTEVLFRSPADCSLVTGLRINYIEDDVIYTKDFVFVDANGNNIGGVDHLFTENVIVKVILDATNGVAFVQNADTNKYLEGKFSELDTKLNEITDEVDNINETRVGKAVGNNAEIFNDYEGNHALSPYSSASGKNTIAGMLGYYFYNVDIDAKKIYLTDTQGIANTDTVVKYVVGDIISMVHGSKYANCSTITAIDHNVITVNSLPITSFTLSTSGDDACSLYVISKPLEGVVSLGYYASTEGLNSKAIERVAHAEGRDTLAYGQYGHAEGRGTKAFYCAHSEGYYTEATGFYSHAEGGNTKATAQDAHAEGQKTEATGLYSHAEGNTAKANGDSSHAEGFSSIANGDGAHAEGAQTQANGNYTHAEGGASIAEGEYSHAEGSNSIANGQASHAEGHKTQANGVYTHAEGDGSQANGDGAHAEGYYTEANGEFSHTEGCNTKANQYSHAEGHYSSANGECSHAEGYNVTAEGNYSHAEGNTTKAKGEYSHAEGIGSQANAKGAHAEGYYTEANGEHSHAEGYDTTATGNYSHAEGNFTSAKGESSHSEGHKTSATNPYAHAEGYSSHANGEASHVEGYQTYTYAKGAHAEGYLTNASGMYSHAEGSNTSAYSEAQHVEGRFNKPSHVLAHILGNGTDNDHRSNAHTIDWSGNAWFAGNVKVGGTSESDPNAKVLATEQYVDDAIADISGGGSGVSKWELLESYELPEGAEEITGGLTITFPEGYNDYVCIATLQKTSTSSNSVLYPSMRALTESGEEIYGGWTFWDEYPGTQAQRYTLLFERMETTDGEIYLRMSADLCTTTSPTAGRKGSRQSSGWWNHDTNNRKFTRWTGIRISRIIAPLSNYIILGRK